MTDEEYHDRLNKQADWWIRAVMGDLPARCYTRMMFPLQMHDGGHKYGDKAKAKFLEQQKERRSEGKFAVDIRHYLRQAVKHAVTQEKAKQKELSNDTSNT